MNLCEFKARLVYTEFQVNQGDIDPIFKKKKKGDKGEKRKEDNSK